MIDSARTARQPSWCHVPLEPREASNKHLIDDPVPALPFEIFSEAVDEAQRNLKISKELALCSAMTFMSLSAQGLYDARSPMGQLCPLSLPLLVVASSGEGKTPATRVMGGSLFRYQNELMASREADLRNFRCEHAIWFEILKAYKAELRGVVKEGKSTESIKKVIADHHLNEPSEPVKLGFLYEDSTEPALFGNMSGGLRSAGWISSEASGIINGNAFGRYDKINSVNSGDGVRVERASRDSYYLPDVRLAICLMVQPSVFESFNKQRGDAARGTGFLARFLVCRPKSTQGTRIVDRDELSWYACDRFGARSVDLYKAYVESFCRGGLVREEVRLSDRAADIWIETRNEIERQILEGGRYAWAPDHASKLAEIMLRIAANFHVFEGRDGDISETTMRAAIELGYWFSRQFERMFSPDSLLEIDASELHSWLRSKYNEDRTRRFDKTYIGRYSPYRLRNAARLELLYEKLVRDGFIRIVTEGRAKVVLLS